MKYLKNRSNDNADLIQGLVMLIVIAIVGYGDVMFIKVMWNYFPDGFLRIFAVIGAIATALSIIALLLGKKHWFRPGKQLKVAYGFTAVEVAVSILNVLIASGVDVPFWRMLAPATPFAALVGWIVIIQLDRSTQEKHEDMEMEDEIRSSERAYTLQKHRAAMRIREKALEYNEQYMLEALESPQHQQTIAQGAESLTRNAIHGLTGRYIAPTQQNTVFGSVSQPQPAPAQPEPNTSPLVFSQLDKVQVNQLSQNGNGNH